MKKFLIQFALYALLFLVLNVILYGISYYILNKALFKLPESKTVLVIGDSTTECAVNDTIFSASENVSQSGTAYIYSYVKLNRFLEENKHIKLVLLSIHAGTLMADDWVYGATSLNEKAPQYVYLFGKDEYCTLGKKSAFYSGMLKMPLTEINTITKSILRNIITYKDLRIGKYRKLEGTHLNNQTGNVHSAVFEENKLSTPQVVYLKKIIDLCKEKNVEVVLITTPMYGAKPNDRLNRYLNKNFQDITYLDYSAKNFPDEYYFDVDHLNYKGAEIFSKEIMMDIDTLFSEK